MQKSTEELLQRTCDYLYASMSQDEANQLLSLYKTYTSYQKGLFGETKSWGIPANREEAIDYLHRIQDYRRKIFGREAADALFGASLKSEEYLIRRGMIAGDANRYGVEKEKLLDGLKYDMWGNEGDSVDSYNDPLNRYYEKLKIYKKDLAEMKSEDEKKEKVRQFREELFTPEQVNRLEQVDKVIGEDKKKEEDYYDRESRINNDPNLDASGKANQIHDLQDEIFGSEADAFRRRLVIEKERHGIESTP